ncbi:MAG: hypothetical protein Q9216_002694 [Gyalolechia sp. 2 TL-2023]
MKLDPTHLRYLTPEDWRVLTAVEIGSKNHEVVPTSLIIQIANLRSGSGVHKSISTLAKANLIARVQHAKYDGYRLTYGGLDYLALHTHLQRKTLHSTGPCIGTGKESDIHIVLAPPHSSDSSSALPAPNKNTRSISSTTSKPLPQSLHHHHQQTPQKIPDQKKQELILKIHRLGRISFRTIKTNRDYLRHRSSATWLHMSRLSALKEHTFMTALFDIGFPVPRPVAWNRHTVVMSLIRGTPLYQVRQLEEGQARKLYAELMDMIVRLAGVGLIHGDFNEFNIMIEEREEAEEEEEKKKKLSSDVPNNKGSDIKKKHADPEAQETFQIDAVNNGSQQIKTTTTLHPILIDFPQMLSISHPNAPTYFERDVNCVKRYFSRRHHFTSDDPGPFFADVEKQRRKNNGGRRLDIEAEASGFSKKMGKELEKYMENVGVAGDGESDDANSTGSDSDDSDKGLDQTSSGDDDAENLPTRRVSAACHQPEDEGNSAANDRSVPARSNAADDTRNPVHRELSMPVVSSVS